MSPTSPVRADLPVGCGAERRGPHADGGHRAGPQPRGHPKAALRGGLPSPQRGVLWKSAQVRGSLLRNYVGLSRNTKKAPPTPSRKTKGEECINIHVTHPRLCEATVVVVGGWTTFLTYKLGGNLNGRGLFPRAFEKVPSSSMTVGKRL